MKATFKIEPRKGMAKATRDELSQAGIPFTGVTLREGQTIQFPPLAEMEPCVEQLGKAKVYLLNVILDNKPIWIPFGAFNKTPHGTHAIEFLDKFETNREICEQSSYNAAMDLYAGKTLKVKEIFIGQKPVFVRTADGVKFQRNADNSVATQPGNFPIFEWVE